MGGIVLQGFTMAFFPKMKGTTETEFQIGAATDKRQTFDASNLTANRTWVLPDIAGLPDQTPSYIHTGDTFIVGTDKQVLFAEPISVDGYLVVD